MLYWKGGGNPPFFNGDLMETFLFTFAIFTCGVIFNALWGYLLGLGFGVNTFQTSMINSLILLAKNVQSVYEIHKLKYMSYEMLNRDQKYIEFQKKIDENELKSLKNTLIRDYINSIPPKYNHMVKFHDWDSAMFYLNKILKERKDDKVNRQGTEG